MKFLSVLLALLITAPAVLADAFEFSVSNDSAEATYDIDLSNSFSTRISGLYSDVNRAHVDFDNGGSARFDTSTTLVSIGLYNHGKTGPVTAHLGGELFWVDPAIHDAHYGGDETSGLALGGAVDGYITPQFFIVGSVHFAPDILTSGKYENFLALKTKASYQLLPNTAVSAGYRYLKVRGKDLDVVLYSGPFLGFKFSF